VTNLSLQTSIAGRAAVIALSGELDLAGATALERELTRLEAESAAAVVLDLRDVDFMDSSGLRQITLSAQRARELGRRLALVPGAEQVMRVFEITRMRERLDFVDDPREVTGAP
jgi:anti-anti-sigma factor